MSADGTADVADAGECGRCGGPLDGVGFSVEAEYPPDSYLDPGRFAFQFCADCADALATDVLVDRAISRDCPIYAGILDGRTRGETR